MANKEPTLQIVKWAVSWQTLWTFKEWDRETKYNWVNIQEEFCMQDDFENFRQFMDHYFAKYREGQRSINWNIKKKSEVMEDARAEFRDRVKRIALSNAVKEEQKKYKTVVKNLLSAKNILLQGMAKNVLDSLDKETGKSTLSFAEQKSILEEIRKETWDILDPSKGIEDETDALKDRLAKDWVF